MRISLLARTPRSMLGELAPPTAPSSRGCRERVRWGLLRAAPDPLWGELAPPTAPQERLCRWSPLLGSFGGYSGAPGSLGGQAGGEADLDRGQVGVVAQLQDRADDPVDLLPRDGKQGHLADHEQVAVLVQREAEHVAGGLPQQQVAEQASVLLLGRAHEERLDPQRPVPHLEMHADPELALAGQDQEPATLV